MLLHDFWERFIPFVVAAESAFGAEQLVKKSIPCGASIESITLLGTSIDDVECVILGSFNAG